MPRTFREQYRAVKANDAQASFADQYKYLKGDDTAYAYAEPGQDVTVIPPSAKTAAQVFVDSERPIPYTMTKLPSPMMEDAFQRDMAALRQSRTQRHLPRGAQGPPEAKLPPIPNNSDYDYRKAWLSGKMAPRKNGTMDPAFAAKSPGMETVRKELPWNDEIAQDYYKDKNRRRQTMTLDQKMSHLPQDRRPLEPDQAEALLVERVGYWKTQAKDFDIHIPFITDVGDVYSVAELTASLYAYNNQFASERDIERLARAYTEGNRKENQSTTMKWFDFLADIPGQAAEFGLTAGAFTIGKKAAKAGLKKVAFTRLNKLITESLMRQQTGKALIKATAWVAPNIAGVAAQAAAMMPTRGAGNVARQIAGTIGVADDPNAEGNINLVMETSWPNILKMVPRAYLEGIIDMGTERLGGVLLAGLLGGAGGVARGAVGAARLARNPKELKAFMEQVIATPIPQRLAAARGALLQKYLKSRPNGKKAIADEAAAVKAHIKQNPGRNLDDLMKTIQFHGPVQEWLEEELGAFISALAFKDVDFRNPATLAFWGDALGQVLAFGVFGVPINMASAALTTHWKTQEKHRAFAEAQRNRIRDIGELRRRFQDPEESAAFVEHNRIAADEIMAMDKPTVPKIYGALKATTMELTSIPKYQRLTELDVPEIIQNLSRAFKRRKDMKRREAVAEQEAIAYEENKIRAREKQQGRPGLLDRHEEAAKAVPAEPVKSRTQPGMGLEEGQVDEVGTKPAQGANRLIAGFASIRDKFDYEGRKKTGGLDVARMIAFAKKKKYRWNRASPSIQSAMKLVDQNGTIEEMLPHETEDQDLNTHLYRWVSSGGKVLHIVTKDSAADVSLEGLDEAYQFKGLSKIPGIRDRINGTFTLYDQEGIAVGDAQGLVTLIGKNWDEETVRHELFHAAWNLGMFTPEEKEALRRTYAPDAADDRSIQEQIAWAAGRHKPSSYFKGLARRLSGLLEAFVLRRGGRRVLEKLHGESKIWKREGGPITPTPSWVEEPKAEAPRHQLKPIKGKTKPKKSKDVLPQEVDSKLKELLAAQGAQRKHYDTKKETKFWKPLEAAVKAYAKRFETTWLTGKVEIEEVFPDGRRYLRATVPHSGERFLRGKEEMEFARNVSAKIFNLSLEKVWPTYNQEPNIQAILQSQSDSNDIETAHQKGQPNLKLTEYQVDWKAVKKAAQGNTELERRFKQSYGMKPTEMMERVKEWVSHAIHVSFRAQEHLKPNAGNAVANEGFRMMKELVPNVIDQTHRHVEKITRELDKNDVVLMSFALVMENMTANMGYYDGTGDARGFLDLGIRSLQELEKIKAEVDRQVAENPKVQQAIAMRGEMNEALVDELSQRGLIPLTAKESSKTYLHQQVLSFVKASNWEARLDSRGGAGRKTRSFQKARVRSKSDKPEQRKEELDYNTNFIESESTWVASALMELEKDKLLDTYIRPYNIREDLRLQAKADNFRELVEGQENVERIEELRAKIKESREGEDAKESDIASLRRAMIEELQELDPTYEGRKTMATGFAALEGMNQEEFGYWDENVDVAEGVNWDMVRELASRETSDVGEGAGDPSMDKRIVGARSVMKGMKQIRQVMKDHLGDRQKSWYDYIDELEGYDVWTPQPGNAYYKAFSIPEKLAESVMQEGFAQLQIDDLAKVIAMGGPRRQMVLPENIVEQLNLLQKSPMSGAALSMAKAWQGALRYWKVWTLMAPMRWLGYMLRNFTGDFDPVLGGAPGVAPAAWKHGGELWRYTIDPIRAPMSDRLQSSVKYGVIGAGLTNQEIPGISQMKIFKRLYEQDNRLRKIPMKFLRHYFETVRGVNEFRESFMRFGAYNYYLDALNRGDLSHFGAARQPVVERLVRDLGNEVAAAHLSRNLLGDYGNLTVLGRKLRANLIPFWSWKEINLKRYPMMGYNAVKWGMTKKGIPAKVIYTAGAVAALSAMYGTFFAWNNFGPFSDDEENLNDFDRSNPHVLGPGIVFRNVGAFGDFIEWGGLNTFLSLFPLYQDGQLSMKDILKEMGTDTFSGVVQGLNPIVKGTPEIILGASGFPDIFNWQPRDRDEIVAGIFGVNQGWKSLKGFILSSGERGDQGSKYWLRYLGLGTIDPGRSAMFEMISLRERFLTMKGQPSGNVWSQSAVRHLRAAATNDDFEAFQEARLSYLSKGFNYKKFLNTLKYVDPLSAKLSGTRTEVNSMEWEFEHKFLTGDQRRRLEVGRDYAQDLAVKMWDMWQRSIGGKDTEDLYLEQESENAREVAREANHLGRGSPRSENYSSRGAHLKALTEWKERRRKARMWFKMRGFTEKEAIDQWLPTLKRDDTERSTQRLKVKRFRNAWRD